MKKKMNNLIFTILIKLGLCAFINAQTSCTPTSTMTFFPTNPTVSVGATTGSPTTNTAGILCSLDPFDITYTGRYANQINIHTTATKSPSITTLSGYNLKYGKTTSGVAPTATTSSQIQWLGVTNHVFSAQCGNIGCAASSTFNFVGRPRCNCNLEGNIPSSTYASPAPTPTPMPQYYGYKVTDSPSSTSSDAFYPTQVGYWIFNFDCLGVNSPSQRYISLFQTGTNTLLMRALKDFNGYQSLTITKGYRFDTIGGVNDGVYAYCDGCEIGIVDYGEGPAYYCSFTAFRGAP